MDSRPRFRSFLIFVFPLVFFFPQAEIFGKDLGVRGKLYDVVETDMLSYIKSRTRGVDMETLREEMTTRIEKTHRALSSVSLDVPAAEENRVRYVDPSVKITSPLYDHAGREILSAGTVNPFDHMSLSKSILVLREDQIQTTIAEMKRIKQNPVLILTDGDLRKSSIKAGQNVYRATGFILQRLQIEKVPSLVTQDGRKLRVQEIVVR